MRAEKVIYTLLSGDAGVATQVAARIYPSRLPQNTVMPALVYDFISGQEHPVIDASAGRQVLRSRVQVTAMGKNYADVKTLMEAVRVACLYKRGTIGGVTVISITRNGIGPDLRDDQLALYLQSTDYMVTHYES